MKSLTVVVPPTKRLLQPAPGFEKKKLAEHKIDLLGLCEFGCRYCSSNFGNYLRIRREPFADLTEWELGRRLYPESSPELTFHFPDVVGQLSAELATKAASYGVGKTLMVSMLTDPFSPSLVKNGTTKAVFGLLLEKTSFKLRVLTKSSIVGNAEWCAFFSRYRDRVVVGLSVGTMDDDWSRRVEVGTSQPSARLRALRNLQDAGVPTFGMLCPVFPAVLQDDGLERLIADAQPSVCEHIWAEPYNDRANWRAVRDTYAPDTREHAWFNEAFAERGTAWSANALELYQRLRARAEAGGWMDRLRYLLYEHHVAAEHVAGFGDLRGILLQSKPAEDGHSQHAGFARVQRQQRDAGACNDAR